MSDAHRDFTGAHARRPRIGGYEDPLRKSLARRGTGLLYRDWTL